MTHAWKGFTEDILQKCMSTFGQPCVYLPKGGSPFSFSAVFDNEYRGVDPNTGITITSTQPVLGVKLSDMASQPAKGDIVQVESGDKFRIIECQPDGQGGAKLFLHREKP